jgi:photosystem II stability/assembly factor-like uncharacterized protein
LHRIDNVAGLNLNAIRAIDGEIFIAAERGHVFRLDRMKASFSGTDTGYLGSFFGIVGGRGNLRAYGLRGTAFRSGDDGTSWQTLSAPTTQTITGGIALPDGQEFILVDAVGQLLFADDTVTSLTRLPESAGLRASGIGLAGSGQVVITGFDGIKIVDLRRQGL